MVWVRSEQVLWRAVLDDVVLAAAGGDEEPMALSGGTTLWERLEKPRTEAELSSGLRGTSGESMSTGGEGLRPLLLELDRLGLVKKVG